MFFIRSTDAAAGDRLTLFALAADERPSVRIGTTATLAANAARDGGADALVQRAEGWLFAESRDERYGAAATALDAITDPHALAEAADPAAILAYLDGVVHEVVEAPRAAEWSPAVAAPPPRRALRRRGGGGRGVLRGGGVARGVLRVGHVRARGRPWTPRSSGCARRRATARSPPSTRRSPRVRSRGADPTKTSERARGRGRKRRKK